MLQAGTRVPHLQMAHRVHGAQRALVHEFDVGDGGAVVSAVDDGVGTRRALNGEAEEAPVLTAGAQERRVPKSEAGARRRGEQTTPTLHR